MPRRAIVSSVGEDRGPGEGEAAAHEGQGQRSAETAEEGANQGHGYAHQGDVPQVSSRDSYRSTKSLLAGTLPACRLDDAVPREPELDRISVRYSNQSRGEGDGEPPLPRHVEFRRYVSRMESGGASRWSETRNAGDDEQAE